MKIMIKQYKIKINWKRKRKRKRIKTKNKIIMELISMMMRLIFDTQYFK